MWRDCRDSTDIRLNNAYGRCLLKKCDFARGGKIFRKAVEKYLRSNPNPYDYEPYYDLGTFFEISREKKKKPMMPFTRPSGVATSGTRFL